MRRVAFLTAEQWSDLYADDRLLLAPLARRGVEVVPVRWDQATQEQLETFEAVVMRSPWDWFKRRDEFRRFLRSLHDLETLVLNAPRVLSDYADKLYLPRLEAVGVPVVPTVVLSHHDLTRVPALMRERGWTEGVLKPAFTANAFDAHRVTPLDGDLAQRLAPLPHDERWLLQPFMSAITDEGEWSLLFFGGRFSHAVKKSVAPGDWRVQEYWGGEVRAVEVSPTMLAQAATTLERAAPGTLYARVDGVMVEGVFRLMELELVEPDLYLRCAPGAEERFADALLTALRPSPR
jgi:glutathione synthase/RimK-type ligase-like ATP-grasp enzyme